MEQTVEKSCWGITLWAIAVVVGVSVVATFVSGSDKTAINDLEPVPAIQASATVSG